MVLDYKGAPPFKVPVQSITGEGYARPGASETTLKQISQVLYRLDLSDRDHVRELMSLTGLKENVDWWLIKWADEGIPNPGTGVENVLKIKIPSGSSKIVAVPMLYHDNQQILSVRMYATDSVEVYIQRNIDVGNIVYPTSGDNYSVRTVIGTSWKTIKYIQGHSHGEPYVINIEIKNDGTNDVYVYIARLVIYAVKLDEYFKSTLFWNERDDIAGTTWDQFYRLFISTAKYVPIYISVKLKSDGTNPITLTLYIGRDGQWVQIWSVSTTSNTTVIYTLKILVKLISYAEFYPLTLRFVVDASLATSAYAYYYVERLPMKNTENAKSTYKRISGSYTSNGDGTTDTVTIIDYTNNTKHISRLLRVKATGDTNTTQLQLQVDGEVVWDFLSDGDTCELDIRDVHKIELLVNDNGSATTTSTTTVNYVVQYEEEDSVICR